MNSQRVATNASNNTNGQNSGSGSTISQSPVDSHHQPTNPTAQPESYVPPSAAQPVQPYSTSTEHYANQTGLNRLQTIPTDGPTASAGSRINQANSYPNYSNNYNAQAAAMPPPASAGARRYSIDEQYARPGSMASGGSQHPPLTVGQMHPPPMSSSSSGTMYASYQPPTPAQSEYRSPPTNSYQTLPGMQTFAMQPGYASEAPASAQAGATMSPPTMPNMGQFQVPNSRTNSMMDFNVLDQFTAGYAMPVFGGDGFNRSPQSALDDALFNQLLASGDIDLNNAPSPPPDTTYESHMPSIPMPKLEPEPWIPEPSGRDSQKNDGTPGANGMDLSMRESIVSEHKQGRLIEVVRGFENTRSLPGRKSKEDILAGDTSDPNHPMSVNMFKTYLTSFWIHIHQQMPIMHRPTFNAETCPDALLLAMACLGACCLERTHSQELIKQCAELAFFCADHIRWEVFKDAEFRPTAKLWTFQTMLLLELFEKMYSTRALHERAHIHHATTLTVMRRGSSLIGRSTLDTPSGPHDPTRTPPGPEGTINTSGQNTPDAWWNRWITAEATRRVAFAAFIIDSTHATLFGHAAVMSPHDIRLPLPCDEALWSATSSAEVQRVEASLAANGFKPVSFLEGLKKMLNGQKVRTNIFGRVILMAGLLNVSWHMNQRDLQVSSIGASNTLGNPIRWRSPLTRAFDFWRREFDESLAKSESWPQVSNDSNNKSRCHVDHRDNVFESRTCLHSLAHMAMHADIVDCEVFAGSDRALGRVVTEADRAAVQKRMREQWAPSARARDATFYALRFLCEVLIPEGALRSVTPPSFTYSARDDYLLNRPWILYFACMIVWSYGYALDGPINPPHFKLKSRELQVYDMQNYLIRLGGVSTPEELEGLKDRNECVGMLILLRDCFRQPRWELLHEAADMFQLCIELLLPGNPDVKAGGAHA